MAVYTKGQEAIVSGSIVYLTDTIKLALLTSSYTPDQDAHVFWSDVSTNEVANGAGYTAGGATVAGKAITTTDATNKTIFDASDVTWTALTKAFKYAVLYKDTGVAGTSKLLAYFDLGAQTITEIDYTAVLGVDGFISFTAA